MCTKIFSCSILLAIGLAMGMSLSSTLAEAPASPPAPLPGTVQPTPPVPGGGAALDDSKKMEENDQHGLARDRQTYGDIPGDAGTLQIGDLLRFWMENGRLKGEIGKVEVPDRQPRIRFKVQGLADPAAATAQWMALDTSFLHPVRQPGVTDKNKNLIIVRYNFDQFQPGQVWKIQLRKSQDDININMDGIGNHVSFSQNSRGTTLNITPGGGKPPIAITGASLAEILQQHPAEVHQYLVPVLLRLAGSDPLVAGPTDFYSVFTDISADPAVAKALADLLVQFDSDSPDKRETASAELAKLGAPGILAVLRLDRSKLSQEQKTRCEPLLRTGRARHFDDPAAALRDVYFLLDAMNFSDVRVREAAKTALEKLQGHAVDVDVSPQADAANRLAALDKLRADYTATIIPPSPATQPATRPTGGV